MIKVIPSACILLFITLHSPILLAEEISKEQIHKWEFGLGLGYLSIPHYRGSDQSAEYVAPIPYLRYNGDRFKVDREGGRFYLYNSEKIKMDLSLAFAVAVNSNDNDARKGMPDLDSIIEIGPRIQYSLYESDNKDLRIRLGLPVRAAFAVDFDSMEHIGWFVAPYLEMRYFYKEWENAVSIGPTWASNKYHDYFYTVAPQYARPTRPAYNASSGYSGSRISYRLSKRYDHIFLGLFMKYDDLHGATFIDSPLIRQNDSFVLGAVISWVFYGSKSYVPKPEY